MQVEPVLGNLIVYDRTGAIMARYNISKDAMYFPVGQRKGDKLGAGSKLHTGQANNMSSIPLGRVTRAEMFHRPLGLWNPIMSKKVHIKGQDKLQSKHLALWVLSHGRKCFRCPASIEPCHEQEVSHQGMSCRVSSWHSELTSA